VAGHLILAMRDPVVLGRLESLAVRHRLVILDDPAAARVAGTSEAASIADVPITAAAELELPGAIDRIAAWRRRWPEALLAGSIRIPDQELWHGALAAGADLVANRGAFVAQLERAIVARGGGPGIVGNVRRMPVRLMERDGDGLVGRLPDAPGTASAPSATSALMPGRPSPMVYWTAPSSPVPAMAASSTSSQGPASAARRTSRSGPTAS
jgi:hypothetical protein